MIICIKNVKIIQENSILYNHIVLVEEGIIKAIIPKDTNDVKYNVLVDGNNQFLTPGFIDIHNHGNSGSDVMDATEEALEAMSKYHLSNGVTSFCGATMTNPKENILLALKNVKNFMNTKKTNNSRLLGVYLEGPYFSMSKKGAQPGEDIKNPDLDELKEFIEASGNSILAVSLAPELEGAKEMIQYCVEHNITVALGHTDASYEPAQAAIDLGANLATHLYNGMRAYTHREPGVIGACLTNDTVLTELICDGIHLHKTAVKVARLCKGNKNIVLISDAMRAAGLPDGLSELGGQQVISKDGVARLLNGALAGSTLNLKKAVKNMTTLFDTNLLDAVNMASINPARAIGVDKELGSIEVGKIADLLIINQNVEIQNIIKDGVIIK